jgi:hypothetical protein
VGEIMRSIIVEAFSDLIGRSQIAALDLAAHYRELSEKLRLLVRERIDDEYGLDVPALFILNVSLPPEVEKALDTRTSMGVLGDLGRYQQLQLGNALGGAASGSGSGLGQAVGVGAGLALGQQLAHPTAASPALPPPLPGAAAAPALPPLLFHVSLAGQSQGPLVLEQLVAAIAQGQITASTPVWTAGMPNWLPAAEVPALRGYFAAPPPPPPAPPPPAAPPPGAPLPPTR